MVIAFLWDWNPELTQTLTWKDGLAAALRQLKQKGHNVFVIIPGDGDVTIKHEYFDIYQTADVVKFIKRLKPNVILHWADMTRPHAQPLRELGIPQAICFAGGEPISYNTPYFDHIFVESEVYKRKFEEEGYSVSLAFGTNTSLFKPVAQPKLIDTIFPATFAAWKRHELFARATNGLRSVAVGYMYGDHEQECWQVCLANGVAVLPHVSAEALERLYAASRIVVVPSMSSGGSQRTVLEAMAMNIPLVITDSDKFDYARGHGAFEAEPNPESIRGYIDAILDGEHEVNTRDYILANWSENNYADELERGLGMIL